MSDCLRYFTFRGNLFQTVRDTLNRGNYLHDNIINEKPNLISVNQDQKNKQKSAVHVSFN